MKRLVLRKGFTFQRSPEGAVHLVDGRTGDMLLIPPADTEVLAQVAKEGLEPATLDAANVLERYAPFVVTGAPPAASFYELDIADAPTLPTIPSVAPITKPVGAVAPRVPSFHELAIPPSVAPAPPKKTTGSFAPVAAAPPPATDTWSVLSVAPPTSAPKPPAEPTELPPVADEWSVAAAVAPDAASPGTSSGSHVAQAVSPMLPSLDDLVPPRTADAGRALISRDSPPPASPSPVPSIPAVAPLSPRPSPVPAIAPVAAPDLARTQPNLPGAALDLEVTQTGAPAFDAEADAPMLELEPLPEQPDSSGPPSTAELELRQALAASAEQPPPETMPDDVPLVGQVLEPVEELNGAPAPSPAPGPEQFRSQEENLRAALDQQPQSRAEVQALLSDTAKSFEPPTAAAPAPELDEAALPSSKKPMILTFVGVMLLALGVAASFTLRPEGEKPSQPSEPTKPPAVAAAPDAATPAVVAEAPEARVDAGADTAPTPIAEAPTAPDASAPVAPAPDAGVAVAEAPRPTPAQPVETNEGVLAEVTGRGRVKMGEVAAAADGVVSWTVEAEQRVKSKQALGALAREGGAPQALTSPAVGLAMLKQPEGASVKKGAVLAEIIYFEAWAKAQVKGTTPTPAWRCEVVSEAAGQRAPCKISVVTPKGGGAQVTVAIEPRWFDTATDAVLRLAAP